MTGVYSPCQWELRDQSLGSCVKEEVGVLGAPSLIVRTTSVDVRTVHSSWKAETPCQNEERVTALALFWSIICASSMCLWSSSVQSVYHGLQQTRGWPCPVLCHSPIGFSTVTIPSLVRQIGCATRRLDSEFFMDLARITSVCPWNHCTERGQGRLCRTNK